MCISDSAFSECDLTIYGYAGSYAETYAAENDIPFAAIISVTDEASGVVLNGAAETIPANASLQVNCLDTAENRITYDITLMQNGEPVQPTGEVTVKIPVPETMDGDLCRVYRAEADGTYTDMNAVYQNGYMVFTTDHFSRYILQAAPRVEKDRSQVRFTAENGDIADAFDYRLISSIPDVAWDLYFDNGSGGTTITAVGFVAANESDRATLADAQAAVENGTALPAGWKTADTDYIQKTGDDADAYFGCIIKGIRHSEQTEDIVCSAYIAYTTAAGQTAYVWYDAPIVAPVATNYDAAADAWREMNA